MLESRAWACFFWHVTSKSRGHPKCLPTPKWVWTVDHGGPWLGWDGMGWDQPCEVDSVGTHQSSSIFLTLFVISHFVHLGDLVLAKPRHLYTKTQVGSLKLVPFWVFGAHTTPHHILAMARKEPQIFISSWGLTSLHQNLGCVTLLLFWEFEIFRHAHSLQELDTWHVKCSCKIIVVHPQRDKWPHTPIGHWFVINTLNYAIGVSINLVQCAHVGPR